MLKRTVEETIAKNALCTHNDTLLVALSGGADSVALLHILCKLGYKCKALHCNFHLRGAESDRDEEFVRNLCRQMDIELKINHFNTLSYSEEKGISVEMAARELRYEWFNQCIGQGVGNKIAVAHHKDDNVETFLINLTRGSGLYGLKGISIKNGNIIRPLLDVSRSEIISYLKETDQKFVTDSTNLKNEYTRNKIRLDIIPLFEKINPSFKNNVSNTIRHLKEALRIYENAINASITEILNNNRIDIRKLKETTSPQTVLFEILYPLGFNPSQINEIFLSTEKQSGKRFISHSHEVIKDREHLIIKEKNCRKENIIIPFESELTTSKGTLTRKSIERKNDFHIIKDKRTAYIDKEKIHGNLKIRRCETGDSFVPLGMKGTKKISDFLTDIKKSIIEKEETLLLTDDRNIIWVIGERLDDRYKITDNTRFVEVISINQKI